MVTYTWQSVDLVWYGIVALMALVSIWKYSGDKSVTKYKWKRFRGSNVGKFFYGVTVVALVGSSLTVLNPITDTGITQWVGGVDPYSPTGASHLDYLGATKCTNVKMTFDIQDGYDVNGNYAGTGADAATVTVYGSASINEAMSAEQWDFAVGEAWDLFLANEIDLDTYLKIAALTAIESKAAASGVWTSDLSVYNSNYKYLVEIGTYNAAENGDCPLKSQFVHGILQGDNSANQPTGGCTFGLGVIKYWNHFDSDDVSIVLETKNKESFTGGSVNDWSDDADNKFELAFEITMAGSLGGWEAGLHSYYEQANNRWWHWYITVDLGELNCTSLASAEFDFNFGHASGFATDTDGAYGYVQISEGHLYTTNDRPNDIANLYDAAGDNINGYLSTQWFLWNLNIDSLSAGGSSDNDEEISIDIDLGTDYNVAAIVTDGQLRDDGTALNYHISGAAQYKIVY